MAKRMLIDATHPEETRVVVLSGTRLEEFDVESSTKKQLKGNIYLAKVVRVEPSLQAAFVEYGGNRHGFLAFSEIHPDYYQIPIADRQALLAEQAEEAAAEEAQNLADEARSNGTPVEVVGGAADAEDEVPARPRSRNTRNYKIQEVIKRREIMLVQVVKEERGNKGAALTTYISLAGRYCVLMPNTTRGGGVSRKITSAADRKRLKSIMGALEVDDGMAVILRTAGQERSRAEIKRDYDYLRRAWDQIRETTFASYAPALIYEEGSLIKRAIRDIYSRDIEEILVEGEEGYRLAKDFMKTLTPSHARKVQAYRDPAMPLFHRFQVESQLDSMHSPTVQLRSGGYIVLNQTEALVAIDVNSGRATRERNIEETATKTNIEAAEEVARQLRLRDLAGLVVIDFIDMEESRNNAAVERKLKEALKSDRARIQVGRISHFGLLELSRQRLRPSLQETTFQTCQHCNGAGLVRSVQSAAIYMLRILEEEGVRRRSSEITITVPTDVALYILNQKRHTLQEIERRYDVRVFVMGDPALVSPEHRLDRVKTDRPAGEELAVVAAPEALPAPPPVIEIEAEVEDAESESETDEEAAAAAAAPAGEDGTKRRRRRRKRRGRRPEGAEARPNETLAASAAGEPSEAGEDSSSGEAGVEPASHEADGSDDDGPAEDAPALAGADEDAVPAAADDGSERPARRRRSRRGGRRTPGEAAPAEAAGAPDAGEAAEAPGGEAKPRRRRAVRRKPAEAEALAAASEETVTKIAEPVPSDVATESEPEPELVSSAAEPDAEPEPEAEPAMEGMEARGNGNGASHDERGNGKDGNGATGNDEAHPADADETAPSPGADQPRRRGWWQRLVH